ncbi:hypothetical protein [Microbispora sp. NPDC046933]|uniref:hypothetical protein n=1 Tax=Microbispora sp. NPDC046933 TaxID=3155618 RepID=UPI0033C5616B
MEKFKEWTDPARELPEDAVDLDQMLTDVSIYWFTETAASAGPAGGRPRGGADVPDFGGARQGVRSVS